MTWSEIIMMLLGGTSVASIVTAIWYRHQNKTIKDSEATQAHVEAQTGEIDLASKYRDEVLNLLEMVKAANEKNFINQDEIIRRLERLDSRMETMELKVSDIEGYLNGPYHTYLAEKGQNPQSRYGNID